jgi:hypothetical protein
MRKEIREQITASIETKQVELENLNIQDNEMKEIANEIKSLCPEVDTILLKNNKIGDSGAIALAKILTQCPKISFLDLQFNAIGRGGFEAVLGLKKIHPDIYIALHGNLLSDTGEVKIIEDTATRSFKI